MQHEPSASAVVRREGRRGRDRRHLYPGRARRIAPTFTDAELADVTAAAEAVGLTPTGFCAEAVLTVARRTSAVSLDAGREALAQLQGELFAARVAVGRIGANLNQGIAALNATGAAPAWLERAAVLCERRMALIDEVVARVDGRLGERGGRVRRG